MAFILDERYITRPVKVYTIDKLIDPIAEHPIAIERKVYTPPSSMSKEEACELLEEINLYYRTL